jgi:hypothetical protein
VRVGDMQLIYAALKRKVVSPVKMLVEHWLSFPNLVGDVSYTSLITRIVDDLGILGDATVISIVLVDTFYLCFLSLTFIGKRTKI